MTKNRFESLIAMVRAPLRIEWDSDDETVLPNWWSFVLGQKL